MPFRPMPLLDFNKGIYEAQEPWRAPPNSFVELNDAYTNRGRLLKRKGYTKFGELGTAGDETGIGTGGEADSGTLSNIPLLAGAMVDKTADTYAPTWTNVIPTTTAYAWTDAGDATTGVIVERIALDMTSVAGDNYTATIHGMNNPRSLITITDGAARSIVVPYLAGSQFGGSAVTITDSDLDSSATNTWTPATTVTGTGTVDITFSGAAGGTPDVTYDRIIGTVVYATGVWSVDYTVDEVLDGDYDWLAEAVDVAYEYNAGNPVMGIKNFFIQNGTEFLVAFDTDRIWVWNETTERFTDAIGSITWNGANSDFFQAEVFENTLFINNNFAGDEPEVFDPVASPNTVTNAGVDFDGAGAAITSASFFLRHKNRGVYFSIEEDGVTRYPQRARYTPVNDIEYSSSSATVSYAHLHSDAPTEDSIAFATHLGDDILVMFNRSGWILRYNGDPTAPYEWQHVPSIDGAAGRFGWISLGTTVIWRGEDGLNITDGVTAQPFDFDIPTFTKGWNQDAKSYSYGVFVPQERQALLTYADRGDTLPEDILAIQLDKMRVPQSFAHFSMTNPFHCMGRYRGGSNVLWNDVTDTWDDADYTWDSQTGDSGAVFILGGDRNSTIYKYADGFTDAGTAFTGEATTVRLNPAPGRRTHCSYVEIIADAIEGATIRLYAYKDYSPTPYLNKEISLSPINATDEKVIRQVRVNAIANFHTFRIEMSGSKQVAIDQIAPFLKVAGPMRETTATPFVGQYPYVYPFMEG